MKKYKRNLSGGWLSYGQEYHLGGVYLDGAPFRETFSLDGLAAAGRRYFIAEGPGSVTIYASFGDTDPNRALAEINVRECVFFPVVKGLRYIAVDGFTLQHAAANWAYWKAFQRAALGTYWGKGWLIQNSGISRDNRATSNARPPARWKRCGQARTRSG